MSKVSLTPAQKTTLAKINDGVAVGHNPKTIEALVNRKLIQLNKSGSKILKAGKAALA